MRGTEAPMDHEKQFVSTVVPLVEVGGYILNGYIRVGESFMDGDVEKITIKKAIKPIKEGDN